MISAHLSVAENLQHVGVKRLHRLVMAGYDLLLDGVQVQRIRHLLVVLAVPEGKADAFSISKSTLRPNKRAERGRQRRGVRLLKGQAVVLTAAGVTAQKHSGR